MVRLRDIPGLTLAGLFALAAVGCDRVQPDVTPPKAVTDLVVSEVGEASVTLTWTAPENPGESVPALAYDLRYAIEPVDETWKAATPVDSLPPPGDAGASQTVTVGRLVADIRYSFALRTRDAAENWSGFSNLVWAEPSDDVPPAAITDLAVADITPTEITLTWTAPGDDGTEGTAAHYLIRRASEEITAETWDEAAPVTSPPVPGKSGTSETFHVMDLEPAITHYFAVRAEDDGMNLSGLSNPVFALAPRLPRTWYVSADGSGDAPTIQAAIDSSGDADTLVVLPGEYRESLNIDAKAIVLRAQAGPDVTILNASGTLLPAVTIASVGRGVTLEGFTITGGCGDAVGAIVVLSGAPTIRGNLIRNNGCASAWGGGLLCPAEPRGDPPNPLIEANVFQDNDAAFGGGLAILSGSAVIRANIFRGNRASFDGGAIFIYRHVGHVLVKGNRFLENEAGDHGGALACWHSTLADGSGGVVDIHQNLILRNTAQGDDSGGINGVGGAIHALGTIGTVLENTIVFNGTPIACGGGGVVILRPEANWTIMRNIIAFNSEGGLSCLWSPPTSRVRENILYLNGPDFGCDAGECSTLVENTNWTVNPLFCDVNSDDFHLAANSPALGGLSPIGAYGVGCEGQIAEVILSVEADAYLCSDDLADVNMGKPRDGVSPRAVGKQKDWVGGQIGRQIYRFDLSDPLPAITKAYLKVKTIDNYAGTPHNTVVYGIEDEWDEDAVTWNTQPALDSETLDEVTVWCCSNSAFYDVTEYVQAQLAAEDTTVSFLQAGKDETVVGGMRWWQREGIGVTYNGNNWEAPQLLLNPSIQPNAPGLLNLTGE